MPSSILAQPRIQTLQRLLSLSNRYGAAALTVAALTLPDRWIFISILGVWGAFYVKPDIALICVIYATGSLLWTPDPREGLDVWFGLIALYGAYTLFKEDRLLPEAITVSVAINCIGFFLYDRIRWAGFGNENFLVEYLLISAPFIWFAQKRALLWMTPVCCAAAVLTIIVLLISTSDTVWFVLGATLVFPFWALVKNRQYWIAAMLLLLPVNAVLWSGEIWVSLNERFELAYNTLVMWTDAPLLGWGMGSFNFMYPEYQERHLEWFQDTALHDVVLFAGAAHNEYAQALAEYGIVGAGLFALFLIGHRITAPVFVTGIIALIGFPLQNPATALLCAAGLGLSYWHVPSPRSWHPASLLLPIYTSLQRRL